MSTSVHPQAEAGWRERGAEDYERGRPGYPAAVPLLIGAELGVEPGTTILDLAAGTGKLTRELRVLGARVVAVEPLEPMRAQLAAAVPDVTVLSGRAESIPLPDASVRAVTVAQAFHWFDVPAAAAEIARVLDGVGGLAIIRNEWDEESDWVGAIRRFLEQHTPEDRPARRSWREELDATGVFETFAERTVENPQTGDLTVLVRRIASLSAISALPGSERERLLSQAAELLRAHGLREGVSVPVPTRTVVRWARVRGESAG